MTLSVFSILGCGWAKITSPAPFKGRCTLIIIAILIQPIIIGIAVSWNARIERVFEWQTFSQAKPAEVRRDCCRWLWAWKGKSSSALATEILLAVYVVSISWIHSDMVEYLATTSLLFKLEEVTLQVNKAAAKQYTRHTVTGAFAFLLIFEKLIIMPNDGASESCR